MDDQAPPPERATSPTFTPEEKETIIQYDMRSRIFTVTTIVPKHLRRFTKLLGPGTPIDAHGTMRWLTNRVPVLR